VNQFLLSIGVFGVGFVVRPLGGIVIGAYADRAGRKKAMVLTIMLMALSCALIACAPPYAVAGMAAPFIVLAARLIQGFAAGGEFGPGTTLLVEYASDSTRVLRQLELRRDGARSRARRRRRDAHQCLAAERRRARMGLAHSVRARHRRGARRHADPPAPRRDAQ
jgi:MFS family permease